jgi:hypothetical protein
MLKTPKIITKKAVSHFSHQEDKHKNIPIAELQSVVDSDTKAPRPYKYTRNTDLELYVVLKDSMEPSL